MRALKAEYALFHKDINTMFNLSVSIGNILHFIMALYLTKYNNTTRQNNARVFLL